MKSCAAALLISTLGWAAADDKWIWSRDRSLIESDSTRVSVAKPVVDRRYEKLDEPLRAAKLLGEEVQNNARYEVEEALQLDSNTRPQVRPRPPFRPPTATGDRDGGGFLLPLVPGRRPPPPNLPVLTGPIPSWEKASTSKDGDPTRFDQCKCSFSFNCRSPGIQFGHCDDGKQYCCYNDFNNIKDGTGFGVGPLERYDKPQILVGPGGPKDNPNSSGKPNYSQRPRYETENEYASSTIEQEYNRRPYQFIPQRPVLPPYTPLHNDYRSSK